MKLVLAVTLLAMTVLAQTPQGKILTVNTLGENLSVVDLASGSVTLDALPLGLYTNDIARYGNLAFVTNSGLNEIQVIDTEQMVTLRRLATPSGSNPYAVLPLDDQNLAVSLLFTNQLLVLNYHSGEVVATLTTGSGPEGIAVHSDKIYVANTGFNGAGYDAGEISVYSKTNLSYLHTVTVGTNPQSVAAGANGNIYVACTGDYVSVTGRVDVIDSNTDTVIQSIETGTFITSVHETAVGKLLIGTFGFGVMVYDLGSASFIHDAANPLPGGPAVSSDAEGYIMLGDFSGDSVRVFNPQLERHAAYLVGDGPVALTYFDAAALNILRENIIPVSSGLLPNYPNPFNPQTNIPFFVEKTGMVQLEIFSVSGQSVRLLTENNFTAGQHEVSWDGRDNAGHQTASGIYFVKMTTTDRIAVAKIHLLR